LFCIEDCSNSGKCSSTALCHTPAAEKDPALQAVHVALLEAPAMEAARSQMAPLHTRCFKLRQQQNACEKNREKAEKAGPLYNHANSPLHPSDPFT
jgi:hypothetical protein